MNTPQSAPPRLDKEPPQAASESTRPSYWLRDPHGALIGPFTKSNARTYVEHHTDVAFEACRDGEDQWQAADVRLAITRGGTHQIIIAVTAAAAIIAVLAYGVHTKSLINSIPSRPAEKKTQEVTPAQIQTANRQAWIDAIKAAEELAHCSFEDEASIKRASDHLWSAGYAAEDPGLKSRITLVREAASELQYAGFGLRIVQKLQAEQGGERWAERVSDERAKAAPKVKEIETKLTSLRLALADWKPHNER